MTWLARWSSTRPTRCAGHDAGRRERLRGPAEVAKLGTNAGQRIDAVTNWWRARDDGRALDTVLRMAPTAGTVHALERLMSKFVNQGASSFNRAPKASGGSREIEGWDRMTFEQRRYAQHARRR